MTQSSEGALKIARNNRAGPRIRGERHEQRNGTGIEG
jgi:hypothetical protein